MKIYLILFLLLFPNFQRISSLENKVCFDDVVSQDLSLLYVTSWNECSICHREELVLVIGVIKNRITHKAFPDVLDSVLLQDGQFSIHNKNIVPKGFKRLVDSIYQLPPNHNFLYFRSKGYKYSKWMKNKRFRYINKSKHEFA